MLKIKVLNEINEYKELVVPQLNKYYPRHRWFNLVESYSTEFVRRIIAEQQDLPTTCLDPFAGTGTTALTCQSLGINCYSIETNPFFSDVAKAKLQKNYDTSELLNILNKLKKKLANNSLKTTLPFLESKTFFENKNLDKWIFNRSTATGIYDILNFIDRELKNQMQYALLFKVALGSILVELSNVFRNGKCLSYKNDWQADVVKRKEVHKQFFDIIEKIILPDIRTTNWQDLKVSNTDLFINGDTRKSLEQIPDDSVDLVITSPPYLNSRDYTDVYRLELWILGYISTYKQETILRKSTLTSHVQIPLNDVNYPNIRDIRDFINHLEKLNGQLWNKNIPNMVKGYFNDMEVVFRNLKPKLKSNSKVYINVSNSAYGGIVCEVDVAIAKIAQSLGYETIEIRVGRYMKSSSQQKLKNQIRESIIVLKN